VVVPLAPGWRGLVEREEPRRRCTGAHTSSLTEISGFHLRRTPRSCGTSASAARAGSRRRPAVWGYPS